MLALRENQWRSTQSEKSNPFLKGFNHEVLISRRIDAQDMFASDALTTIQSAFRQLDLAADCSAQAAVMRDRLLAVRGNCHHVVQSSGDGRPCVIPIMLTRTFLS